MKRIENEGDTLGYIKELLNEETGLHGIDATIERVFPDPAGRPSKRTFEAWKRAGIIPYVKINRKVFYDPSEIRRALEKQFKVKVSN